MAGLEMKYFVLKPRGEDAYARASRRAMRAYADAIMEANPILCAQLRAWADEERFALEQECSE
jgi:hypothetical protein